MSAIKAKEEENEQRKTNAEIYANTTMRTTNYTNFDLDRIENKVTQIMQKYCTPVHLHTSRFEPGRNSTIDGTISSFSSGTGAGLHLNR